MIYDRSTWYVADAMHGRFEINQLLFTDDTALVADSEEKLC